MAASPSFLSQSMMDFLTPACLRIIAEVASLPVLMEEPLLKVRARRIVAS